MKVFLRNYKHVLIVGLIVLFLVSLSNFFWNELHILENSLIETLRNIGLLVGGTVAIYIATWRSFVTEQQAKTAKGQWETAQLQFQTAQKNLLHERYRSASELLRSDNLHARLSAIDTLRQVITEQPVEYHVLVMRRLTEFLRYKIEYENENNTADDNEGELQSELRYDLQVALEVVGSRNEFSIQLEKQVSYVPDLHGAKLRFGKFLNLNLSHVLLSNADLANAEFRSTVLDNADLNEANLENSRISQTNLNNAKLDCARLNFVEMIYSNLSNANLSRASLDQSNLINSSFINVSLSEADVKKARLYGINLTNAILICSDFTQTKFIGVRLQDAELNEAILSATDFTEVNSPKALRDIDKKFHSSGLTQMQLETTVAKNIAPILDGVVDPKTGEQFLWRGEVFTDN